MVVFDQGKKAFFAILTASFTSFVIASLTSALCSPVAGLKILPFFV